MRPPRDDSGVASTIATLFSFLVIFAFMSAVFEAQEVHQKDREWGLFREAQESFGTIRQAHDAQFDALVLPPDVRGLWSAPALTVPVTAGLPGEGPFLPPVVGTLACDPTTTSTRLSFSYRVGTGELAAVERSNGSLLLHLGTRELPPTDLVWENGAILIVQPNGALVRDYPYLRIQEIREGWSVTYRAFSLVGDEWSIASGGTEMVTVRTLTAESVPLTVTGRGDADLNDVRDFVRDLKDEVRDVSTDGSGRLTGSYADVPPSEGILNQGLTEQLIYYDNAETKQRIPDCEGASNDMNASARQLLDNVMDKILQGIDEGYIDEDYGLDLHARLAELLKCLDEMSESLEQTCEFKCASLFGGSGGTVEFLLSSKHRAAWARWFNEYFRSKDVPTADWEVEVLTNFIFVRLDRVRELWFEATHLTVR